MIDAPPERFGEVLAAADQVFLFVEEGAQRGTHHLGFGFVAPARDLLQPVVHRLGDLHRQARRIFDLVLSVMFPHLHCTSDEKCGLRFVCGGAGR